MVEAAFVTTAAVSESIAQVQAVHAIHERRRQEWQLQQGLTQEDIEIGSQQVRMAIDR